MNLTQFKDWSVSQGSVAKFTDGQYLGECVSLINQYLARVYGIRAGAWGHAKDWATNGSVLSHFDRVPSPQAGDIGVSGPTRTNPYGHIWIYLSPTLILEQNGRVARRVSINAPMFSPIAILRRKGTGGSKVAIVQDAPNWYARLNKLHWQVRNRELGRAAFLQFVGKDTLFYMEALSDDPEADKVQTWQTVGKVAVTDKWDKQIYALQDQVKALSTRPTRAELDAVAKQADDLAKSLQEAQEKARKLESERSEDTIILDESGSWLIRLFNRLFKKG